MNMFGLLATTKLGEATSGGGFWMPENASATAIWEIGRAHV